MSFLCTAAALLLFTSPVPLPQVQSLLWCSESQMLQNFHHDVSVHLPLSLCSQHVDSQIFVRHHRRFLAGRRAPPRDLLRPGSSRSRVAGCGRLVTVVLCVRVCRAPVHDRDTMHGDGHSGVLVLTCLQKGIPAWPYVLF